VEIAAQLYASSRKGIIVHVTRIEVSKLTHCNCSSERTMLLMTSGTARKRAVTALSDIFALTIYSNSC
jgi:hypothetical protein